MRRPLLLLVSIASLARVAHAQGEVSREAKEQLDRGVELYSAERYAESLPYFQKAYALSRAPDVIFALAQAERLTGQCAPALAHYREYQAVRPVLSAEGQADLQANVYECWQKLPAPVADKPCPEAPPRIVSERTPFYRSIPALGIYTGVLSAGVGVAFLVKSRSTRDRADDAQFSDDFDSLLDEATGQRRIGITFLAVGGALAAGGITYHLVTKTTAAPPIAVSFTGRSISLARAF